MQLCPHCGTENTEGVLFCQQCGIALGPISLATRKLGASDGPSSGTDTLGPDRVLILQLEGDETPIFVQIREEVILGRVTEQSPHTTYINLSPYGADDAGVSRRHARLLREKNAIYLMDLNSTNGTWMNGEMLAKGVEKRVRDGDEITLGRLKVSVFFKP